MDEEEVEARQQALYLSQRWPDRPFRVYRNEKGAYWVLQKNGIDNCKLVNVAVFLNGSELRSPHPVIKT